MSYNVHFFEKSNLFFKNSLVYKYKFIVIVYVFVDRCAQLDLISFLKFIKTSLNLALRVCLPSNFWFNFF